MMKSKGLNSTWMAHNWEIQKTMLVPCHARMKKILSLYLYCAFSLCPIIKP